MDRDHEEMQACTTLCWQCRAECQKALYRHCLQHGGEHVAQDHVKLMADCIQICQTAADFMTRDSSLHAETCSVCAAVCESCADSCANIGDEEMKRCADICRQCAESCRSMSSTL